MKKLLCCTVFTLALWAPSAVQAANPLDALTGIVSSLTSTSKFEISDIAGTWDYQSPAVSFKSDAALNKIGGAAAGAAIEDKLVQYYNAAGLNTMQLTIGEDSTFTMKVRSITLNGTLTKDDDAGNLTFHFNAFGKISLGSVAAMAEKSAIGSLTLTFDASKAILILDKISSIANISSLKTLTSLLNSYDGIYAGARLKKVGSATSTSKTQPAEPTAGNAAEPAESADDSQNASGGLSKVTDALKGILNK